jgi:hypothetical protein
LAKDDEEETKVKDQQEEDAEEKKKNTTRVMPEKKIFCKMIIQTMKYIAHSWQLFFIAKYQHVADSSLMIEM